MDSVSLNRLAKIVDDKEQELDCTLSREQRIALLMPHVGIYACVAVDKLRDYEPEVKTASAQAAPNSDEASRLWRDAALATLSAGGSDAYAIGYADTVVSVWRQRFEVQQCPAHETN